MRCSYSSSVSDSLRSPLWELPLDWSKPKASKLRFRTLTLLLFFLHHLLLHLPLHSLSSTFLPLLLLLLLLLLIPSSSRESSWSGWAIQKLFGWFFWDRDVFCENMLSTVISDEQNHSGRFFSPYRTSHVCPLLPPSFSLFSSSCFLPPLPSSLPPPFLFPHSSLLGR